MQLPQGQAGELSLLLQKVQWRFKLLGLWLCSQAIPPTEQYQFCLFFKISQILYSSCFFKLLKILKFLYTRLLSDILILMTQCSFETHIYVSVKNSYIS